MINQENLNKLYEGFIDKNELSTKEVNSYGFNGKDLTDLINQNILKRIRRGYYTLESVNELFSYGKNLMAQKKYNRALECFKKCYELNPRHLGACRRLFLGNINQEKYEDAFKYFKILLDTNDLYDQADNYFYLYLLSILTDIPDKYKKYVSDLKMKDIKILSNDKRYKDIPQQNDMRLAVLQNKMSYALKQLNNLIAKHGLSNMPEAITKSLLSKAIEAEDKNKKNLTKLIKEQEYEEIIKILEEKNKRHTLSLSDKYALKLTRQIIELQNTKQIPQKTIFQSENLFEAIDGNDYDLAFLLEENFINKKRLNSSDDIIYLLLTDICNIIKQISFSKQPLVDTIKSETEKAIPHKAIPHKESKTSTSAILVEDEKQTNEKKREEDIIKNKSLIKNIFIKDIFVKELEEVGKYLYLQMRDETKHSQAISAYDRLEILSSKSVTDKEALEKMISFLTNVEKVFDFELNEKKYIKYLEK